MANWGDCDFRQLERLAERMEQLSSYDMDRLCREMAEKLAKVLLNRVKKRTPVGVKPKIEGPNARAILEQYWSGYRGGTLRDAWTILPLEKRGGNYIITVINPTEYASYVEFGHRQTPGRYVPALGKSLKASWVKGKFMLTISEDQVKRLAPRMLEDRLEEMLKEVFNAE